MVLLLVARLALAGDPPPASSGGSGTAAPATPAPAAPAPAAPASGTPPPPAPPPPPKPAASAPLYDVVVVKKADPVVPAATVPAPASPAAPAAAPAKPAPFDVTVVKSGTPATPPPSTTPAGAPLGGNITPPPPAPGAPPPPPPPVEAPPEFRPPAPVIVVVEPAAPVAPKPPEPGVGLRVTTGNPYKVKDAAGHRYTAVQLARLVGDTETLRKLADRREFSKIGQTTAAISGGGLLVASLVVVASLDGQPHQLDYSVDPSLYETEEQYQVATDFAQGQYDKAVTSWQSQRLGTALFLAGTGGFVLASSPFIGRDNDRREDRPDLVYSREQAQAVVDKYNAAHPPVGAPTPDAATPTAPAVTPPTPPEELDPDPTVTPDAPDGTAKPVDRSGPLDLDDDDPPPPKVRARVLIGAGMVGVTGSF